MDRSKCLSTAMTRRGPERSAYFLHLLCNALRSRPFGSTLPPSGGEWARPRVNRA